MVVCFDCTYLSPTLCQLRLRDKAGLVGGAWTSHSPMNAFLDLEQDIDLKQTVRSTQILEFIGFDASAKHKAPLSLCSLPIETSHTVGYQSSYRGNLYMAEVVGRLMQQSGGAILALVYDGILHDVSD